MIHKTVLLVLEREGRFLVVKRNPRTWHGMWCFPGGHIDEGETSHEAAVREGKEELGKVELEKKSFARFVHGVPAGEEGGRLPEHEHDCFAFRGRVVGEVKLSKENSEFRWLTLEEIKKLKITNCTRTAIERV